MEILLYSCTTHILDLFYLTATYIFNHGYEPMIYLASLQLLDILDWFLCYSKYPCMDFYCVAQQFYLLNSSPINYVHTANYPKFRIETDNFGIAHRN